MANEENNNLVQLQDENGNDLNFEHLMTLEHEGSYYVLLEATEMGRPLYESLGFEDAQGYMRLKLR